jgi:hypothetical protein
VIDSEDVEALGYENSPDQIERDCRYSCASSVRSCRLRQMVGFHFDDDGHACGFLLESCNHACGNEGAESICVSVIGFVELGSTHVHQPPPPTGDCFRIDKKSGFKTYLDAAWGAADRPTAGLDRTNAPTTIRLTSRDANASIKASLNHSGDG